MNPDKPLAKGDPREMSDRERARERAEREDAHGERNPLGAHPIGTAAGGAVGAVAAGAAVGSVAGPVGAAVGAAIGAAAGGFAGKGIADMVDPAVEDAYWREHWQSRDYVDAGFTYDKDYAPAYRYGAEAYVRYPERHYDEIETDLAAGWRDARGDSNLEWEHARHASRDAWQRVSERQRTLTGDPGRR